MNPLSQRARWCTHAVTDTGGVVVCNRQDDGRGIASPRQPDWEFSTLSHVPAIESANGFQNVAAQVLRRAAEQERKAEPARERRHTSE